MAVPDFDTSRNRECMDCHRTGFDEDDWQFMGYDDGVELYICPDCQSLAMADDDDLQTRVDEQRNAPVQSEQNGAYCTCRVTPVVNGYCFECGLPRPPHSKRSDGG